MANATWLADVLRAAGVPVIEQSGWQSRAQSGSFSPRGLIRHWDASSPGSHGAIEYMQANIACNISTCRGNSSHGPSVHVIAAGRAWHAGEGSFGAAFPKDQGNTYAIGHEVAHTVDEPWTDAQMSVVVAAEQAILQHLGSDVQSEWCTHSEYAPSRKIDTTGGDYGQNPSTERQRLLSAAEPPEPDSEVDMLYLITPDGRGWITDGLRKRFITTPAERDRYLAAGVTDAGTWNSTQVDALPTDPGEYLPPPQTLSVGLSAAAAVLALIVLVLVLIIAVRVF